MHHQSKYNKSHITALDILFSPGQPHRILFHNSMCLIAYGPNTNQSCYNIGAVDGRYLLDPWILSCFGGFFLFITSFRWP